MISNRNFLTRMKTKLRTAELKFSLAHRREALADLFNARQEMISHRKQVNKIPYQLLKTEREILNRIIDLLIMEAI